MNKTETETKKRKFRPLRWFGFFFLALAVLAVMGVFMCRYSPSAYQPLPAADSNQVSTYLTHKLGPDFNNQVQLDKPFKLLVEQKGLNEIIRQQDWVEQFDQFSFTNPVVMFDTDTIYLMGTLDYKGVSSVLTIIAAPQMDEAGMISMNIQSIRLGVLPVTKLVGMLARSAFEQSRQYFADDPHLEQLVQAIINGEPFEPVFEVEGRTVRITAVSLRPQELLLTIQPE